MSIVQLDLPDARVIDLFAGSGALGIEALSRGAREAVFVEHNERSFLTIHENLKSLGGMEQAMLYRTDAIRFASRLKANEFDIAFVDPPYGLRLAEEVAQIWLTTPFARVIGIEHEKAVHLPEPGDRRVYGDTVVTFYRQP